MKKPRIVMLWFGEIGIILKKEGNLYIVQGRGGSKYLCLPGHFSDIKKEEIV